VKPAEYFADQRQRFLRAKGMKEEQVLDLIARREVRGKKKNGLPMKFAGRQRPRESP